VELLQTTLFLGVTLGLVYALVGAGFVVIYRTSGYVSFAQGDIATVGLFVGYFAYEAGLPYWWTVPLVIVTCAVLAGLIGRFVVIPLERFGALSAVLATIGVGLSIQGVEALTVGTTARAFPSPGTEILFRIGPVGMSTADVVTVGVCVLLFIALGLFFKVTKIGMAMRAANDNPLAANHVGLSSTNLKLLSWVIAGVLAGVTGLAVAPIYALYPGAVNLLLVYGFATIVLGGFESIVGALIAGIVLGVLGNLVAAYLNPNLVTFAVYLVVLLVLLFRPNGLLGRRPLVRV